MYISPSLSPPLFLFLPLPLQPAVNLCHVGSHTLKQCRPERPRLSGIASARGSRLRADVACTLNHTHEPSSVSLLLSSLELSDTQVYVLNYEPSSEPRTPNAPSRCQRLGRRAMCSLHPQP